MQACDGHGFALVAMSSFIIQFLHWQSSKRMPAFYTGPTVATVGLSIQVPMAVAAEGSFGKPASLHSRGSAALMIFGAIAVIVGFLGVSLDPSSSTAQAADDAQSVETEMSAPVVQ